MFQEKSISVVVPVFNEEKTVAGVVGAILGFAVVSEIICVNDGSSDKSLKILKSFGDKIKLINFGKNQGKGAALAAGVGIATGKIIVFLDADLIGLKKEHIVKLTNPLLTGEADFALGKCVDRFLVPVSFTGQRAYRRKDLLPYLKEMAETRFGVEVFLNYIFKNKDKKIIALNGLDYLIKKKKLSFKKVPRSYLRMWREMIQTALEIEGSKIKKTDFSLDKEVSFKELIEQLKNKKVGREFRRYFTYLREYFFD